MCGVSIGRNLGEFDAQWLGGQLDPQHVGGWLRGRQPDADRSVRRQVGRDACRDCCIQQALVVGDERSQRTAGVQAGAEADRVQTAGGGGSAVWARIRMGVV